MIVPVSIPGPIFFCPMHFYLDIQLIDFKFVVMFCKKKLKKVVQIGGRSGITYMEGNQFSPTAETGQTNERSRRKKMGPHIITKDEKYKE
jgi:hypothetical protein